MKYQLAMDMMSPAEAIAIAKEMAGLTDIIEIGTPMLLREGLKAVSDMKAAVPDALVLADSKIMDAGKIEASDAFKAGADIVTVCGAAEDATIMGVIEASKQYGGKVLVDMIAVKNTAERVSEIDRMCPDYIQVHTAFDGRGSKKPTDMLKTITPLLKNASAAVAGGIGPDNIAEIVAEKPALVVLGSKILGTAEPVNAMKKLLKLVEEAQK